MLIVKTEIRPVGEKGMGLFAAEPIHKDMTWWVCNITFDKILFASQVERFHPGSVGRDFLEKYGCLEPDGCLYVSMDNARFVNHSDNPNSAVKRIKEFRPVNTILAVRDIGVGEEITCNYRDICEACKEDLGFTPIEERV